MMQDVTSRAVSARLNLAASRERLRIERVRMPRVRAAKVVLQWRQ